MSFTGVNPLRASSQASVVRVLPEESRNECIPIAKVLDHELTLHGVTRIDPYYWLRNRDDPEVICHLQAENHYLETEMAHTKTLQEQIYKEIVGRVEEDHIDTPYRNGNWMYYKRMQGGLEHPIYCRKGIHGGSEEIILDVNQLAPKFAYCKLRNYSPSPNGEFLAFALDTQGTQSASLFIKNLMTGEIIEQETIPNISDDIEWSNDGKSIWYVGINSADRPDKVCIHLLGTNPKEDRILCHENDDAFDIDLEKTRNNKYFLITSESKTTTEVRYVGTEDPNLELHLFHPKEDGLKYFVAPYTNGFFIQMKCGGQNYSVMRTEENKTSREYWQVFRPLQEDVDIELIETFQNHLVIQKREKGNVGYEIHSLLDNSKKEVEFPDECYMTWIGPNCEFNSTELRYGYQSPVSPTCVYTYNMETGINELKQRDHAGPDFDPANYQTSRITAIAADGTEIPISLFYRKGIQLDGSNPLKLYGYGSYGVVIDNHFNSPDISLADRGIICAVAHIRGGGFLGQKWYEEGKLMKKKNTFTDFIDCAEYLIRQGYTSKDRLVIQGGSAGGLLMGSVMNARPDLFKAVIAQVPFVDAVTTMLDDTIPLTTQEYTEWGNPNEKDAFDYMLSYSPYDNIQRVEYPSTLITAGLNDHQVGYWEPAKWCAKLRAMKIGSNPVYLRTNLKAGHHSSSGRYDQIKDQSFTLSFILDQLGIAD